MMNHFLHSSFLSLERMEHERVIQQYQWQIDQAEQQELNVRLLTIFIQNRHVSFILDAGSSSNC